MNPDNPFNFFQNLLPSGLDSLEFSLNSNIPLDLEPVHVGASLENLRSNTETIIYSSVLNNEESGEPDICSICRQNLENNEILRKLKPCSHQFHLNCIDRWFEKNVFCPICRIDIRESQENQSNLPQRQSSLPQYQQLRNAMNHHRQQQAQNLRPHNPFLSTSLPNNFNFGHRPVQRRANYGDNSSIPRSIQPRERQQQPQLYNPLNNSLNNEPENQLVDSLFNSLLSSLGGNSQRRPLRFQTINISYQTRQNTNNVSEGTLTNNNNENNENRDNSNRNDNNENSLGDDFDDSLFSQELDNSPMFNIELGNIELDEVDFERQTNRPTSPPNVRRPEKSHRHPYSNRLPTKDKDNKDKKGKKNIFQKFFGKRK